MLQVCSGRRLKSRAGVRPTLSGQLRHEGTGPRHVDHSVFATHFDGGVGGSGVGGVRAPGGQRADGVAGEPVGERWRRRAQLRPALLEPAALRRCGRRAAVHLVRSCLLWPLLATLGYIVVCLRSVVAIQAFFLFCDNI